MTKRKGCSVLRFKKQAFEESLSGAFHYGGEGVAAGTGRRLAGHSASMIKKQGERNLKFVL